MEIRKNENIFDRFVKMLIGIIIFFLAAYYPLHIIFKTILITFSFWLIGTGMIGYCPLYDLLGISTKK